MDDIFERFTERARQVVVLAQDSARAMKHNYIGTEHVLMGVLREEEGLGNRVLTDLGVSESHLHEWIIQKIGEGDEAITGQIPFTPRAKKVLELALREALSLGHNYIGTEHILLGLTRETEGTHHKYFVETDIGAEQVRNAIVRALAGPGRRAADPEHQIRLAIRNIRQGLQKIDRGLNSLEAALAEQLPADPDENT